MWVQVPPAIQPIDFSHQKGANMIQQTFIFGRDAVREIQKGKTPDQVSDLIAKGECLGSVIEKTFATESERTAYLEGIDDADGWNESTWIQTN